MLQSHGFKGERQYSARGRFFLYQSSNAAAIGGDERIKVEVAGQPLGDFYVGDNIELPAEADSWRVTPYNGALEGVVVIGDGTVRTNRVAGAVSIIDTAYMSTRAGLQFVSSPSQTNAVGKIRGLSLRALGASVAVRRLAIASDLAGDVGIYIVQGDPLVSFTQTPTANKLAGAGTLSTARYQKWDAAAATLTAGVEFAAVQLVGNHYVPANQTTEFPISRPFVLPDGYALAITGRDAARAVTVMFDGEVMP